MPAAQGARALYNTLSGTPKLDSTAAPRAPSAAPPAQAPALVRGWRYARLALHLALGVFIVAAVFPLTSDAAHRRLRQRWSRAMLALLGVELEPGATPIEPGCLVVANHVSWLDVFVINAVCPAAFVSKAEVRAWPVVGWLAAKNETVFLRRGSRGHARLINGEIGALLDARRNVAIFPEGTTTDGSQVLHFHAALLQPAIASGHPVQPAAISYHDAEGRRSRAPAYVGEMSLGECLAAIVRQPRLVARVAARAPLPTGPDTGRRELAQAARGAIVAALEGAPCGVTEGAGSPPPP